MDLSAEEGELSFILEEEEEGKKEGEESNGQGSKSKRKAIFSKYKKKLSEKEMQEENGILKTFDDVFNLEDPGASRQRITSFKKLEKPRREER